MPFVKEVEICAETLKACEAAREGGTSRIELCSALNEGGMTPSVGLLRQALCLGGPSVHVLLRPRGGNFVYSDAEFEAMCDDLKASLDAGAGGFVAGCLRTDASVDEERTCTLVELAQGRPVTFHRAFDHTADLRASLETIIACGCDRILTSGGKPTVIEGRSMLMELTRLAAGRVRIAAGGGITLQTAPSLASIPGLDLHASLRKPQTQSDAADVLWQEAHQAGQQIDVNDVRALCRIVYGEAMHQENSGHTA